MYAPGESPFHVRGSTYLGICEHVKATLPGSMEAVNKAMPAGPHRSFIEQAHRLKTAFPEMSGTIIFTIGSARDAFFNRFHKPAE